MGAPRSSLTPEISPDQILACEESDDVVELVVGEPLPALLTQDLVLEPPSDARPASAAPEERSRAVSVTGLGERVPIQRRAPSMATLPRPIRERDRRGTGDLARRTSSDPKG